MDNIIIRINDLSKVYKLYSSPIARFKEALHPLHKIYHHNFYALQGINFEIKKGDTVGIIGKNGAGKSTLLKIITGVLTPSSGEVVVNGRIASLLELGAGFNPEYTGMENIYFQGTLMGLSHDEMTQKIDNILAFADIGDFIHQPVRMYSSGMFARLAFSVAINVDPDILIVDEALSVGDFAFQYKCFLKFKELKEKGTTILFVTHSMQEIIKNCDFAIYLDDGSIKYQSKEIENVVFMYETDQRKKNKIYHIQSNDHVSNDKNEHRFGTQQAIIESVSFFQGTHDESYLLSGKKTSMNVCIVSQQEFDNVTIGFSLKTVNGIVVLNDSTFFMHDIIIPLKIGHNVVTFTFNANLASLEYYLYIGLITLNTGERIDLDQRWRMKKIKFYSDYDCGEGLVYAPSSVNFISNGSSRNE